MDPSEPVYFDFRVEGDSLPETSTTATGTSSGIETSTSTSVSTTTTTNPFQYSSPGYNLVIAIVTLFVISAIFRRKRI